MNNKYTLVLSFDGLSSLDFDYIKNLPNFSKLLKNSSYCTNVKTIYPSLTYPAHTTIVTGKYPKNHGIINNTLLQVGRKNPDWYWQRKYINGNTLYDQARKKGLKVAGILWPVSGRSSMDYNLPEIFPNRPWQNQIMVSLLNGSPIYQYRLFKNFAHLLDGIKEPNLSNFVQKSVLYTIENHRPNLLLAHYIDLDSHRHKHGFSSPKSLKALDRHDKRLGEIIDKLEEENIMEESNLIVLGDHSSLDVSKLIFLNSLFYKKNYINMEGTTIKDYKVIGKTCDGSSYIYLKDKSLSKEIYQLLLALKEDPSMGVEEVYTSKEAAELGADPNCDFMLEARLGYYFEDEIRDEYILNLKDMDKSQKNKYLKNSHGYSPFKDKYDTVFIISGNGLAKNFKIDKMNLVDIGPTLAKVMDLELKDCDGRILKEIIL